MPPRVWPADELVAALLVPGEPEVAGELVVVGPPGRPLLPREVAAAIDRVAVLPCVLAGVAGWVPDPGLRDLLDVTCAEAGEASDVAAAFALCPVAAASLALHLRATERRTAADGLVAESALYSALQAGTEHQRWRSATPVRRRADRSRRIEVARQGSELRIALTRPAVRNALDVAMRDELLEALAIAEADPALRVVLRGEGPSFCSGGDLDEFGSRPDPATAHAIRLRRSLGAVLHRLRERTTVHVHGRCAGSGVELAAFAGRVVADPGATFELPELTMGLIPGAGGTVSLPSRVGRHRTAWLALTGRSIDAATAASWGLVDEIALI